MSLTLIIEVQCQHFCNLNAGNVDYVCKIIERLSPSSLFKITLPLLNPTLHKLVQCGIMHYMYWLIFFIGLEIAQKNKYIILNKIFNLSES